MNSSNIQEIKESDSFQNSLADESGFSSKKRKPAGRDKKKKKKKKLSSGSSLIGIQLKFLQSENENLKKLVKGLEEHILEVDGNSTDLTELEESNKKLKAENEDLQIKIEQQKTQHKTELDLLQSTCNDYLEKIKVVESKNTEFEETVKKLNEEISLMKTIKSEIKDETENERETFKTEKEKLNVEIQELQKKNSELEQKYNDCDKVKEELKEEKEEVEKRVKNLADEIQASKDLIQTTSQKFLEEKASLQAEINKIRAEKDNATKAEIHDLKEKNTSLEKTAQENKNSLNEFEAKYKKRENDLTNLFLEKQNLQKKYDHELKEKGQNQNNINKMKNEIEQLSKKNLDLMNNNKILQDSVENRIKLVESLKKPDSEENQPFLLDEVAGNDDGTLDLSLLSCNTKKILIIPKIKGKKGGIDFCSATNEPCFIGSKTFSQTCFKLTVTDEFIIESGCMQLNEIIPRLYMCNLRKIHLCRQKISVTDLKLLSEFGNIQICILEQINLIGGSKKCEIYEALHILHNIAELKYEFRNDASVASAAYNLSNNLKALPRLEKFELLNIPYSFKLEDFSGFINRNNKASFTLKFSNLNCKFSQATVDKGKNKMLNSIYFDYNISIEYRKNLL